MRTAYKSHAGGTWSTIRTFDLDYTVNKPAKTTVLDAIRIQDAGGKSLPATVFTYQDRKVGRVWVERRCQQTDPCKFCNNISHPKSWDRPFLTHVTSGYGGKTRFLYQDRKYDGHLIFQEVRQRRLIDEITVDPATGGSLTGVYDYGYTSPRWVYETHSGCQTITKIMNFGRFFGFQTAEVLDPGGVGTRTVFNNGYSSTRDAPGYLNGRTLETQRFRKDAGGNITARYVNTKNTWQVSQGTAYGWPAESRFVQRSRAEEWHYEGSTGPHAVAKKKEFVYDLQYGHLQKEIDYTSDGAVYRTKVHSYSKHASEWLFRKTSENLYQGATENLANLVESTWYSYDNHPLFNAALTEGKLTAERRWLGGSACVHPIVPFRFADSRFQHDRYGNVTHETRFDGPGGCETYTSESPRTMVTAYSSHGLFPQVVTNPLGQSKTTLYNFRYQMPREEQDLNGNKTATTFDSFGRIETVKRPGESAAWSTRIQYAAGPYSAASPYRKSVTERLDSGRLATTHVFFDGLGRPIQTHGQGDTIGSWILSHQRYDNLGRQVQEAVPTVGAGTFGRYAAANWSSLDTTRTTYDGLGRELQTIRPNGERAERFYHRDASGAGYTGTGQFLRVLVDANGHAEHEVTDIFGNRIRVREFTGDDDTGDGDDEGAYAFYSESRYAYDVRGLLTDVWDSDGHHAETTYDKVGHRTVHDDPDLGRWTFAYDVRDNLVRQTDARGVRTHFTYDTLDRVTTKDFQNTSGIGKSHDVTYSYDETAWGRNNVGHLTKMVDLFGSESRFSYDVRGQRVREQRILRGQLADWHMPGGFLSQKVYGRLGKPLYEIYPNGDVITTGYTERGLPYSLSVFRALGRDAFPGSSLGAEWASGGDVSVSGGLARLTGNGSWSTHMRRKTSLENGGGVLFDFKVRNAGDKVEHFLARGGWGQSNYRRFGLAVSGGSIRRVQYQGTQVKNRTLMPVVAGRWYQALLVVDTEDNFRVVVWERENPYQRVEDDQNLTGGWQFDDWSYRSQIHSGRAWIDNFVELSAGWSTSSLALRATYDAESRLTRLPSGPAFSGQLTSLDYYSAGSENGRLQKITGFSPLEGNVLELSYWYDDVGNISRILDANGPRSPQNQHFRYDELDRLKRAHTATSGGPGDYDRQYNYNTAGNLTSRTGLSSVTYTTAHPHAATGATGPNPPWTFAYDANGNMTQRKVDGTTFGHAWNAENKLTRVTGGPGPYTFRYDGDGARLMRQGGGTQVVYIGDRFERHYVGKQPVKDVRYFHFNGRRFAMLDGDELYYLHSDHLNSSNVVTRADGSLVSQLRHRPFGTRRWNQGSQPSDIDFTGQRREDFKLLDYGARFYEPRIGRFLSADSVYDPGVRGSQGLNRYTYVGNNPVRFNDPSGRCWLCDWADIATGSYAALTAPDQSAAVDPAVLTGLTVGKYLAWESGNYFDIMKDLSTYAPDEAATYAARSQAAGAAGTFLSTAAGLYQAFSGMKSASETTVKYLQGDADMLSTQKDLAKAGIGTGVAYVSVAVPGVGVVVGVGEVIGHVSGRGSPIESAGMLWAIYTEFEVGDTDLVIDAISQELSNLSNSSSDP